MFDEKEIEVYEQVKSTFPAEFGLRAFPGKRFRLSDSASYFNGGIGEYTEQTLVLYVERHTGGDDWRDFVKGSAEELRANITAL